MKEKVDSFINSQAFVVVVLIGLICLSGAVSTYAWFTWRSADDPSLSLTIGELADVTFENGPDITGSLNPVFYYYDGEMTKISVINKNEKGETCNYKIKINIETIPEELRNEGVKYTLVKNDNVVVTGNFASATDDSSIDVYTSSLDPGTTSYIFYLYIDSNDVNDNSMMNKTLVGELTLEEV